MLRHVETDLNHPESPLRLLFACREGRFVTRLALRRRSSRWSPGDQGGTWCNMGFDGVKMRLVGLGSCEVPSAILFWWNQAFIELLRNSHKFADVYVQLASTAGPRLFVWLNAGKNTLALVYSFLLCNHLSPARWYQVNGFSQPWFWPSP